jgi:hypothetical protein
MPIHDWSRVEAGIFHHFHHRWIASITDALNDGVLPAEYYALAEQQAAGFGPDVLTLQTSRVGRGLPAEEPSNVGGLVLAPPKVRFAAELPEELFQRKRSTIVVRHVSDDVIVAVLEVISPGNKASRRAFRSLIDKACELLAHGIHLLILDLFPPTARDPRGIHGALWDELTDARFTPPPDKPLSLVAYELAGSLKAYVEPVAVGDSLPPMPLFLERGAHVLVPFEAAYRTAFANVPQRWRDVLDAKQG